MLRITLPEVELWDEEEEKFYSFDSMVLELEHSLASLSKWESKFEKPFLTQEEKTPEEIHEYFKCMVLTPDVPEGRLNFLSEANILEINQYIDSKQTATWFSDSPNSPKSREVITAELIYYWMVSFQIPWEAENWHLSRLFTLIKVCGLKNQKPKKMSRSEMAQRNRELNAQRRAQLGTRG